MFNGVAYTQRPHNHSAEAAQQVAAAEAKYAAMGAMPFPRDNWGTMEWKWGNYLRLLREIDKVHADAARDGEVGDLMAERAREEKFTHTLARGAALMLRAGHSDSDAAWGSFMAFLASFPSQGIAQLRVRDDMITALAAMRPPPRPLPSG
jgi:hypothetical protein